MLERLVAAVRSPKLADQRSDPAGVVLAGLVSMAVARMRRCADHLNVDSLDEEWEEAWQEMGRLEWVVGVAAQVLPEESATIQQQLLKPRQLLSEVHNDHHREPRTSGWRISFRSRPLQPAATSSVRRGSRATFGASSRDMGQDQEEARRVSAAGGVFVVFEGGDGVGKTTQVDRLCAWLADAGHEVLKTFEPGDTTVGAMIRRIVLDPATGEMSPRAEALLYAADKAQHIYSVVRPALDRGGCGVRPLCRLDAGTRGWAGS